jgi:excisionase family DNA binding protein
LEITRWNRRPARQPTSTVTGVETKTGLLALLTVEEAAQRLSVGRTTLYALLKNGQINSIRVGRLRRIPTDALTAYTNRLAAEQHAA